MIFGRRSRLWRGAGAATGVVARPLTFVIALLASVFILLIAGCGSGSDSGGNNGGNNNANNGGNTLGVGQSPGTITGTVVDQYSSNQPVANVSVVYVNPANSNEQYTTTTASDGTFTLQVPNNKQGFVLKFIISGYYNTGFIDGGSHDLATSGFPVTALAPSEVRNIGTVVLLNSSGPPPPPNI